MSAYLPHDELLKLAEENPELFAEYCAAHKVLDEKKRLSEVNRAILRESEEAVVAQEEVIISLMGSRLRTSLMDLINKNRSKPKQP